MKTSARLLVFMLATTIALQAQALSGVWEGMTPGGQPLRLELAAKNTTLTGTMTVAGQKTQIAGGKVAGKTFTFSATLDGGTEGFSGEVVDAKKIRLWMDDRGPGAAITLERREQ